MLFGLSHYVQIVVQVVHYFLDGKLMAKDPLEGVCNLTENEGA